MSTGAMQTDAATAAAASRKRTADYMSTVEHSPFKAARNSSVQTSAAAAVASDDANDDADRLVRCCSGGSLKENETTGQLAQSHASTFVGILAAPLSRSSPLKSQPAAAAGGLRADPTAAAAAPSSSPAPAVPSFSKRRVIRPTFLGEFHPQQAPSMPFESALTHAAVDRMDDALQVQPAAAAPLFPSGALAPLPSRASAAPSPMRSPLRPLHTFATDRATASPFGTPAPASAAVSPLTGLRTPVGLLHSYSQSGAAGLMSSKRLSFNVASPPLQRGNTLAALSTPARAAEPQPFAAGDALAAPLPGAYLKVLSEQSRLQQQRQQQAASVASAAFASSYSSARASTSATAPLRPTGSHAPAQAAAAPSSASTLSQAATSSTWSAFTFDARAFTSTSSTAAQSALIGIAMSSSLSPAAAAAAAIPAQSTEDLIAELDQYAHDSLVAAGVHPDDVVHDAQQSAMAAASSNQPFHPAAPLSFAPLLGQQQAVSSLFTSTTGAPITPAEFAAAVAAATASASDSPYIPQHGAPVPFATPAPARSASSASPSSSSSSSFQAHAHSVLCTPGACTCSPLGASAGFSTPSSSQLSQQQQNSASSATDSVQRVRKSKGRSLIAAIEQTHKNVLESQIGGLEAAVDSPAASASSADVAALVSVASTPVTPAQVAAVQWLAPAAAPVPMSKVVTNAAVAAIATSAYPPADDASVRTPAAAAAALLPPPVSSMVLTVDQREQLRSQVQLHMQLLYQTHWLCAVLPTPPPRSLARNKRHVGHATLGAQCRSLITQMTHAADGLEVPHEPAADVLASASAPAPESAAAAAAAAPASETDESVSVQALLDFASVRPCRKRGRGFAGSAEKKKKNSEPAPAEEGDEELVPAPFSLPRTVVLPVGVALPVLRVPALLLWQEDEALRTLTRAQAQAESLAAGLTAENAENAAASAASAEAASPATASPASSAAGTGAAAAFASPITASSVSPSSLPQAAYISGGKWGRSLLTLAPGDIASYWQPRVSQRRYGLDAKFLPRMLPHERHVFSVGEENLWRVGMLLLRKGASLASAAGTAAAARVEGAVLQHLRRRFLPAKSMEQLRAKLLKEAASSKSAAAGRAVPRTLVMPFKQAVRPEPETIVAAGADALPSFEIRAVVTTPARASDSGDEGQWSVGSAAAAAAAPAAAAAASASVPVVLPVSDDPVTQLRDFTPLELQLAAAGMAAHSSSRDKWSLISAHFLPHWPRKLLAKAWTKHAKKLAKALQVKAARGGAASRRAPKRARTATDTTASAAAAAAVLESPRLPLVSVSSAAFDTLEVAEEEDENEEEEEDGEDADAGADMTPPSAAATTTVSAPSVPFSASMAHTSPVSTQPAVPFVPTVITPARPGATGLGQLAA